MPAKKRVLITGITGLIGQIVYNDLKRDYEISGLARRPMEGVRHFRGSIDNLEAILPPSKGRTTSSTWLRTPLSSPPGSLCFPTTSSAHTTCSRRAAGPA